MTDSKAYKMIGITDEVTSCDCCGRTDLKRTVVLERTDDGVIVYFGTTCGARAIGWTTKEFAAAAKDAQIERQRAITRFYNAHPASQKRQQSLKEHYDNGGTWQTAPFDYWRALDTEAREATRHEFNASIKELAHSYV